MITKTTDEEREREREREKERKKERKKTYMAIIDTACIFEESGITGERMNRLNNCKINQ